MKKVLLHFCWRKIQTRNRNENMKWEEILELIDLLRIRSWTAETLSFEADRKLIFLFIRFQDVCLYGTVFRLGFTNNAGRMGWTHIKLIPKSIFGLFIGGPGDSQICERILKNSARYYLQILPGQLSFLQSAALMGKSEKWIMFKWFRSHAFCFGNECAVTAFIVHRPAFGFGPLSDDSRVNWNEEKLDLSPLRTARIQGLPHFHFKCA